MPIISVEIMKTIDEREMKNTTKEKQTKTERSNFFKEKESYKIYTNYEIITKQLFMLHFTKMI